MEHYEIHNVHEGRPLHVHACTQISDHAAIRRAEALTQSREGFEVWRAGACVYVRPFVDVCPSGGRNGRL